MSKTKPQIEGYNGLTRVEPTLPTRAYLDQDHFETELLKIWYRNWIYVCRSSELDSPRAYRVFELGSQRILIVRNQDHRLRAFHNTCRHRGSSLVQDSGGCLPVARITCPYHLFAYDLDGKLKNTPTHYQQEGFDPADYSLYDVAIEDWQGFIFIHLDPENAQPIESSFSDANILNNWSMNDLVLGHVFEKTLRCNWKVFWENFSECLHCPNIHPKLSRLVPLYKQNLMEVQDDPNWEEHQRTGDPRFKAGLSTGAETWSEDGTACADYFPNLTPEEIAAGHTYCETRPSAFIVGHVDYVRTVRVLPIGPEQTSLRAEWLFQKKTLDDPKFDLEALVSFAKLVIEEDGAVAEINQRGLHSIRHEQGVLMAEEYEVHAFHKWVKQQIEDTV